VRGRHRFQWSQDCVLPAGDAVTDAEMFAPLHRPLSDYDRDAIRYMAEDNRPRIEIAGAVGRCVGTVKSEIRRIRLLVRADG
jgi:DNA-directed RNA polymerase specialized sigma24 family protein